MNIKRGLFRLWLIGTVVWFPVAFSRLPGNPYYPWGAHPWADIKQIVLLALMLATPPAIVLVLGMALLWALRGFRRSA